MNSVLRNLRKAWLLLYAMHGLVIPYPLLIFTLATLFFCSYSLPYFVLIVSLLVLQLAYLGLGGSLFDFSNIRGLVAFAHRFRMVTFRRFKPDDILSRARDLSSNEWNNRSGFHSGWTHNTLPAGSFFNRSSTIYCYPASANHGPLPDSIVSFSWSDQVVIVGPGPPSSMTPINVFMFLHEIGHTSAYGLISRSQYGPTWLALPLALAIPVLLTDGVNALLAASLILAGALVSVFMARKMRKMSVFLDENFADLYAFEVSDPRWFDGLDAHLLATMLSGSHDEAADTNIMTSRMVEGDVRIRKSIFADRVRLVQSRKSVLHHSHPYTLKAVRVTARYYLLLNALAFAAIIIIAVGVNSISWPMAIACLLISLAAMFVLVIARLLLKTIAYTALVELGLTPIDAKLEDNRRTYRKVIFGDHA